ncbi:TPA: triose-phosphate isomerase [Candidatus Acetothermia bacterium]|nr:triose-phosphate isomerase [Candidatus Acetothermia bacterium]
MRVPLVAANWKMHKTVAETRTYVERLIGLIRSEEAVEVVLLPSFTSLPETARLIVGTAISVGAQNAHPEPEGAYTGEVSVAQIADLGARYVLCGHSERRRLFGEDDALVGRKVHAAHAAGIAPILCVGETFDERRGGRAWAVVERQLDSGLASLGENPGGLVIAYEPVWAIGTGVAAQPSDAQEMAARIRGWLRVRFGPGAAEIRIQYGGSVKPGNARQFVALPDVDGALVGGGSLDPDVFCTIVQAARR